MPDGAIPEVKCVECGLLSLQLVGEDGLGIANLEYRETGKPASPNNVHTYKDEPRCYVNAKPIHKQVPSPNGYTEILALIRKTHHCECFLEWMPGRTPKEHLDMDLQRQILQLAHDREDADRKWRKDCDERDRTARESWEREQRTWRQEDSKTESKRFVINLIVLGVVVSLVTAVSQIVGSMIQAAWIPNPRVQTGVAPVLIQSDVPDDLRPGTPHGEPTFAPSQAIIPRGEVKR